MEELTPRRRQSDRPSGKMRKGMYILPSLFTTANIAAGFYAILQTVHGALGEAWHLDHAAMAIGFAVFFDGLDGRIARMTNTASDFGRELDSLADVIAFGVAPALLAWIWGFHLLPAGAMAPELHLKITELGSIACFAFLMAGASRLARFNIAKNPEPSNPGRPGKKYFVGMPIPAGAGVIAAIVHYSGGESVTSSWTAMIWLMMVVVIGYLMISTWRFYSFKDIDFRSRRPSRLVVILGVVGVSILFFSRPVLFAIAILYTASGVLWRLQWIFHRKISPTLPPAPPLTSEASHTS
jgi:CDP-diacylglycerol--serine O-phosphatidyltransferase